MDVKVCESKSRPALRSGGRQVTRGGRVASKSVVMSVRWQQCPAVDETAPSL